MDVTEKENGATVLIIKVRLDPKKLVNDIAISNFKGVWQTSVRQTLPVDSLKLLQPHVI